MPERRTTVASALWMDRVSRILSLKALTGQ